MKKLLRMIIFSGVAIFLTALWNKGFIVKDDPMIYLKAALIIAAVYYLIVPASKLILLSKYFDFWTCFNSFYANFLFSVESF